MIKSISVGLELAIVFKSQEFIAKIILTMYFINNLRRKTILLFTVKKYYYTIKLYTVTSGWF